MNPETKEKLTAQATAAKDKAFAAAAWCKEKIAATWKSGRKGKAICIGGAAVVLLLLMRCGGGESGWRYADEDFSNVFKSAKEDEGVVYQFTPAGYKNIRVVQATKKGNLVCYLPNSMGVSFDRTVWIETKKRYEDDEKLAAGVYVRRGSIEYEGTDGGEHTLARYVEVTDKGILKKAEKKRQEVEAKRQAEEKAREAKEKAEKEAKDAQTKAEEEARKKAAIASAERGAYELDIPIKSLCGFKLGTPPSQIKELILQFDAGTPVEDLVDDMNRFRRNAHTGERVYRMAKPFRLFKHARVTFLDNGAGKHLGQVVMLAKVDDNVDRESYVAETKSLVAMIEKKFGIKFQKESFWDEYHWKQGNESLHIALKAGSWMGPACEYLSLGFEAEREIERLDTAATTVPKASIHLDADAGADQL